MQIIQDLNKIKKILNTLLQTLVSRELVRSFSKNIELYGSWGSSKFSIFQTKWFLEKNRALFEFLYGILHYLISIIWSVHKKNNFILTTQATFRISSVDVTKSCLMMKSLMEKFFMQFAKWSQNFLGLTHLVTLGLWAIGINIKLY